MNLRKRQKPVSFSGSNGDHCTPLSLELVRCAQYLTEEKSIFSSQSERQNTKGFGMAKTQ